MSLKARQISFLVLSAILILEAITFLNITVISSAANKDRAEGIKVKKIASLISAEGAVTAQNQATLHFQTGGKLTSLPVKEGDKVTQGQTIAQLDTYALQKSLQLAANSYQISKNTNDQTLQNNQAGVVEGQQRVSYDTTNKSGYTNTTEAQIITDAAKRFVENSQLTQNSAQLQVDLANYAMQLATLTSPLAGVVTHEDVTVPGVNVSTTTSFTVADPTSVVFRAHVAESDIDYISEGTTAEISLDGTGKKIQGIVMKIYPSKVTLANGQTVYQIDIVSDQLKNSRLDQAGSVLIMSTAQEDVTLVPVWTVLSGKYIWVNHNGETTLKEVKTGRVHGSEVEIMSGLSDDDKVITDPKSISKKKYLFL